MYRMHNILRNFSIIKGSMECKFNVLHCAVHGFEPIKAMFLPAVCLDEACIFGIEFGKKQ